MAAQSEDGSDLVTVCTDTTEGGTLVRVVAPSRHIRMVDLMPVFDSLDITLVSYTAERDPDAPGHGLAGGPQPQLGRRSRNGFRGRFLVTDMDGQCLSDELLDRLVATLQDALHIRLSRQTRCSTLQGNSRRGSVASYATEASIDPESPSFMSNAGNPPHGSMIGYSTGLGPSHLQPSGHSQSAQQLGHHHYLFYSNSHHFQHQHHEHPASGGSMLLSDLSVSSIGSLMRAPSGAASDHPAVPSPPAHTRNEGKSSFPSLHHQQQMDLSFQDPRSQGPLAAALEAAVAAIAADDRYSGGPTTPFGATVYQHVNSRSQPASQPQSQASDNLDAAVTMPQRASSTSSTVPYISGPLLDLHAIAHHGADEASGVVSGARPPSTPGLVPSASTVGRTAHVSFSEPLPCGCSATTSAAATSMTTPQHSRPPSASASFLATAAGTLTDADTGHSHATSTNDVASGVEGGPDGSPASSSDERDGMYSWWSTFSAQDTVARIMSNPARSISADADLGQAKSMMAKHNISALLVNTGGPSPGFITKRDFLKVQFSKNVRRTKVKEVMTQPVIFVDINMPIEQCSRVLERCCVRRVLVHDPSRTTPDDPMSAFVGVVSDADLFKCMGMPAMSPVVGSIANSSEQVLAQIPGAPPAGGPSLPVLPILPSLPSLSTVQSAAGSQSTADPSLHGLQQLLQQHDTQHSQQQLQQPTSQHVTPHQQPGALAALCGVASVPSAPVNVPSVPVHAASAPMVASTSVDSQATTLPCTGSSSSVIRLNAEASLAERYRCAAALWELDFNELEVTRRIGEGSFGEVLLANFRGTKVAVKRLRGFDVGPDSPDAEPDERAPSPTQMPIFRQFFEREIEILATIRHPNVVNFIGACHTPPNVCLVTEYCARGSLDHLLHKSSITLDLGKKVEFSMDIARGMSCLHSQKPPIIHRDLKTANLLVSARFEVKVADFGLSRIKDHAQLINSRAGLEGTVEYAAPEVLRGEPYTEKCDIWSYAVLLWEIIHRQRPYADADVPVYILMMSLGNGTLRLPPVREELATPGLARLVDRCMAWHPAERPSFREVLHALEAEYKILRGKAAAVPRSDSASSMMVLPGTQNRGATPDASGQHAPHGHRPASPKRPPAAAGLGAGAEHGEYHAHAAGMAAAGAYGRAPHPAAYNQHAPLPQRRSSKLGLGVNSPGPDPGATRTGPETSAFAAQTTNATPWLHDSQSQPQPQYQPQRYPEQPQQLGRARVKLDVPPPAVGSQQQGTSEGSELLSPVESSSRPPSNRTNGGSATSRSNVGSGKVGSSGRHVARSLRSAARSKSMPLPEFEWFGGEEGSEDYIGDTTESMADDEAEPVASAGMGATGLPSGGLHSQQLHPVQLKPTHGGALPAGDLSRAGPVEIVSKEMEAVSQVSALCHGGAYAAVDEAAGAALDLAVAMAAEAWVSGEHICGACALPDAQQTRQGLLAEGNAWGGEVPVHAALPTYTPSASPFAASAAVLSAPLALRCSPFHLAASSPFAEAADKPWSPGIPEEPPGLVARFSIQRMQEPAAEQPASLPQVAAAAADIFERSGLSEPPRRVCYVSPFAQLANEVPATCTCDENEAQEEKQVAVEHPRRSRGGVGNMGGGNTGVTPASITTSRPPAAASNASSTDVSTAVEKDQRSSVEDRWGVPGACSKPSSGDVHPNADAAPSRMSPSSNCTSPHTLASAYAHCALSMDALSGAAGKDDRVAMSAGGTVHVDDAQQLVAVAVATDSLETLSLALPGVMAFGGGGLAGVRADSDQFDTEDEDAALHTTAWVRL